MRGSEIIPHKMKMKLYPKISGYGVDSNWDLKWLVSNFEKGRILNYIPLTSR